TQALLSAIPRIDPRRKTARLIMKEEGDSAGEAAEGCVFAGRCPRVRKECFSESRPCDGSGTLRSIWLRVIARPEVPFPREALEDGGGFDETRFMNCSRSTASSY
ncbi:MAG TPA: hypothetical protein PLD93_01490, partial [Synergistaceae bacterium]|nr:hypothetical protein [Synergistaceae bacterium]